MSQEYFCAFHNIIKGKYVAHSPEFPRFSTAVYSSFFKVPCFPSDNIITFTNEGTEGRRTKKEKLLVDIITGLKMDGRNV